MKVEFSLFAGLLVIATALLARVKIQGRLRALHWTVLHAAFAAMRVREYSAGCRFGLAKRC